MSKDTYETVREVADALVAAVRAERLAEARTLALVCELADRYHSEQPSVSVPGGPQRRRAGAEGTCEIDDFLICELHPLLGVGPAAAWTMLRHALNLRDRHPRVWNLVQSGAIPAWNGRRIAEDCAPLTAAAAAWVDERIAPALTRLPWVRARRTLAGLIVRADPAGAAQRIDHARRRRFVAIDHTADGTSWLTARLRTPAAAHLAEVIDAIARGITTDPGYAGSPDEARADALEALATPNPGAPHPSASHTSASHTGATCAVAPADATLVIHLDHTALSHPETAIARVTGPRGLDHVGPVLLPHLRELLAHRDIRVLPVLDLAGEPAADAYEIPRRIAQQVRLRDQHSRFPFDTTPARLCDLDHTRPWHRDQRGTTTPGNLGALGRHAHRAKTHGGWHLTQPRPGTFQWTSPLGYHYQVDHRGTHRQDPPP